MILGAGLSGLTTGYILARSKELGFVILEARDRVGGRILTKDGIDLGATWFQNHHNAMHQLMDMLGLQKFEQRSHGRGILVYNPSTPVHYFESDPNASAAHRIAGGTETLTHSLAKNISEKIHLSTIASEILKTEHGVRVMTNNGIYEAEKVIVTLPPKLASGLVFKPELPHLIVNAMQQTHTWMSNAMKVGLTFRSPFWREKGFSGMVMGQAGAVTELYDHSSATDTSYCLMGFVNEQLRDVSAVERKAHILQYLSVYLGEEVGGYVTYQEKDWSIDTHTTQVPLLPLMSLPQYGLTAFQSWYLENTVLFSGAETASENGGYMDGAVRSGLQAAARLLKK